jgi:hypothetical protein
LTTGSESFLPIGELCVETNPARQQAHYMSLVLNCSMEILKSF